VIYHGTSLIVLYSVLPVKFDITQSVMQNLVGSIIYYFLYLKSRGLALFYKHYLTLYLKEHHKKFVIL
jgi:hypothetical protein